ncbi:hypothetical protein D3C85_1656900 [compost metagenome]
MYIIIEQEQIEHYIFTGLANHLKHPVNDMPLLADAALTVRVGQIIEEIHIVYAV